MLGYAGATFRASPVCQGRATVRLLVGNWPAGQLSSTLAWWRWSALPRC
jgi:hypothetical protein